MVYLSNRLSTLICIPRVYGYVYFMAPCFQRNIVNSTTKIVIFGPFLRTDITFTERANITLKAKIVKIIVGHKFKTENFKILEHK